jgi:two-component system CheB/CheR fusion protein
MTGPTQTGGGAPLPAPAVPICGIGASAGGTEALRAFFGHLPSDLGVAWLVVVHLAPDQPSALAEILDRVTEMPVVAVEDRAQLRPDHVYVIAPGSELVLSDNSVLARPFAEPRGQRQPIDHLFESMALQCEGGIGIVLSGEGHDGATGARALHEAGGVILVQDPREAAHKGMPQAVIATGRVDVTAPVAGLAERVAEILRMAAVAQPGAGADGEALRAILRTLHRRLGHDFSQYKEPTLLRRIGRRMHLTRCASLADYAAHLQNSDTEQHALFSDLLISVTSFFRDPPAFDALARDAVAPIFDRLERRDDPQIRAWSVGCATGEEAYSLAILLVEEAERRNLRLPIQVFATDIDRSALERAREGVYGEEIAAHVSPVRLARFFVRNDGGWRVRQELRELVLFAEHSVTKDPPFIHLDIVLCRNLLIYLDRDLQRQVCGLLHYALDTGGFLLLGTAETVDSAPELFRPVNREMRIYAAEPAPHRRLSTLQPLPRRDAPLPVTTAAGPSFSDRGPGQMHLSALEASAPPSILVGRDRRALHLSPGAGRFLLPAGGPASLDLLSTVRPELRHDLSVALHRALDDGEATLAQPAAVAFNGTRRRVAMYVTPDRSAEEAAARALVVFLDGGAVPDEAPMRRDGLPGDMRRMVDELGDVRERLARSRRENEFAMQELRAANEELQSMNEEYRSTSEELETSKEELQSMNEELQTLNDELKSKLESISAANSDLRNLIDASAYGALFLDPEMRIRLFTPGVTEIFKLADSDIARRLADFACTLDEEELLRRARAVLKDLVPVTYDAQASDGRWYTVNVRPYRTIDERIDGVVITFADVSATRAAAATIRESEERFATLLGATTDAAFRMGPDWQEMRMLHGGRLLSDNGGVSAADWLERLVPAQDRARVRAAADAAIADRTLFDLEHRVVRADGSIGWIHARAAPVLAPDGTIREWFGIAADVTKRKRAEAAREQVAALTRRLRAAVSGVLLGDDPQDGSLAALRTFADALGDRLDKLDDAHEVFSRSGWEDTGLADLVERAVLGEAPELRERILVSGARIRLSPTAATTLSLALHELLGNAVAHGALSNAEGRVSVSWGIGRGEDGGAGSLRWEWQEAGGPAVRAPERRGVGALLLEDVLPGELNATARLAFEPNGVAYRMEAPLSEDLREG